MKEIKLSTNLHCENCVTKLRKVLDNEPAVHHWSADVKSPGKTVLIHGYLSENEATSLIEKAGYKTNTIESAACDMPNVAPQPKQFFWQEKSIWKKASFNTFNCLVGCSIGDFGMIIYLQAFHPHTPMWLQMLLAVMTGLLTSIALETTLLHLKEKMRWKKALQMALSMSLISMIGMEIVMNATDFMITGGKAQLNSIGYWIAFIPAAIAGFLAPLPYNYYQLKKHNRACH